MLSMPGILVGTESSKTPYPLGRDEWLNKWQTSAKSAGHRDASGGTWSGCNRRLGNVDDLVWLKQVVAYLENPPAVKVLDNRGTKSVKVLRIEPRDAVHEQRTKEDPTEEKREIQDIR